MDFYAMLAEARAEAAKARQTNGAARTAVKKQDKQSGLNAKDQRETAEKKAMRHYLSISCDFIREVPPRDIKETCLLKGIAPSVYYCPNWLSSEEESQLLSICKKAPSHAWTHLKRRTLQNWGGHPRPRPGAKKKVAGGALGYLKNPGPLPPYMPSLTSRLLSDGIFDSSCAPNHVLLNQYERGQGIMAHSDGPLYHPVVAILSLGSASIMRFYKEVRDTKLAEKQEGGEKAGASRDGGQQGVPTGQDQGEAFSVVLERGSLLVFTEDAYHKLLHCIPQVERDVVGKTCVNRGTHLLEVGAVIERTTRLSLTIRHVPPGDAL